MPVKTPAITVRNRRRGLTARASLPFSPLLAAYVLAAVALGEPPATPPPAPVPQPGRPIVVTEEEAESRRAELEQRVFAAFACNDAPAAERALRELIPYDKDNFVPWYNLACALSLQGKADEALAMLRQSIARGFADLRQMETDPHLAEVRRLEAYRAILSGWDAHLERRLDERLDAARKAFGGEGSRARYAVEKNDDLRLAYVSAFDAALFDQSKQEIDRLTRWWGMFVLPADEPLRTGGQPERRPPWVLVILPDRADFARWAARRFGDRWQNIGGNYSHDNKQLIAMDLGATLRHEYWHVLHWRHMDQLGQRQPIWVMEGLCSLVEDIEPMPDGTGFRALPSWRTNMARRLAKNAALTPWDVLFAMDQKRFIGSRPLAFYAQSRAIFMFLHERGRLREWYTAYAQGFKDDPTGRAAFESTFGKPLKEIERDFRLWLKDLPEVQETVGNGPANLPFEVGPGGGDGPTIDSLPTGAARTAGLKLRDVITAIDGKPVRDLNELARILGEYEAGAQVEVGYRRGGKHAAARVSLIPPP
ncbi:MAG: TPR end-of-group domain-containing protein [Phycisphaerales bacterium]